MASPPTWLPFPEYVLRVLEHPPHMFVSKLAACCAMLFLNRADPKLLETLCDKWATRFALDRPILVRKIRQRSYALKNRFPVDSSKEFKDDSPPMPMLCDPATRVMHLLRLVNTLVTVYFSHNWQKIDVVIRINKEYEAYVNETLLPMCIRTSAEDGVDDDEEMEFLLPFCTDTGNMCNYTSPAAPFLVTCGKSENASPVSECSHIRQQCLGFATIGNIKEKMMRSTKGIVIIFHAKYSSKSNEVLNMFKEMITKQLIDPELDICVVHAVAEPELANIYDISWFPTVIFTPSKESTTVANDSLSNFPFLPPETEAATSPFENVLHGENHTSTNSPKPSNFLAEEKLFANAPPKVNKEDSPVVSSLVIEKDDKMIRTQQDDAVRALSQEPPAASPAESRKCAREVLYGVTSNTDLLVSSACHSLAHSMDDGLISFIRSSGYCVYPASAPMTVPALVEWIQNKGNVKPREERKQSVNHITVLKEAHKFKSKVRQPPLVILRQMQDATRESITPPQEDAPMFIFLGGGIAAGKSTIAMALSRSPWWSRHKENSVLISADDFKVVDKLYHSPEEEKDMHEQSTRAAEAVLLKAVNLGRSIVFDSTMMWLPFIKQVVSMVRNAHTTIYKQGVGYKESEGVEDYFSPLKKRDVPLPQPYGIHLLAITVEPHIAVPRGVVRKFSTGRGVPIFTQLRSFRLFSSAFCKYIDLMDSVKLYNNNVIVDLQKGEIPPLIAEKSESTGNTWIVYDGNAFETFERHRDLNDSADTLSEIYLS